MPGQPEAILNHYDVRIILGVHRPAFEAQAVKLAPATHTVAVLIGRDILKQGTLLFDGQNETLSFWFRWRTWKKRIEVLQLPPEPSERSP